MPSVRWLTLERVRTTTFIQHPEHTRTYVYVQALSELYRSIWAVSNFFVCFSFEDRGCRRGQPRDSGLGAKPFRLPLGPERTTDICPPVSIRHNITKSRRDDRRLRYQKPLSLLRSSATIGVVADRWASPPARIWPPSGLEV